MRVLRQAPNCDAPAGSACRTRGGKTAAKYHTPRFVLVPALRPRPALREELEIPVPADRLPGRAWKQGPALAIVPAPRTERPLRVGYARTSTARQELASQLEALHRAECHKVFKEQISTRIKVRPELEKALALARQFKEAAPETPVIFTVHELKRLARNAAELMTVSGDVCHPPAGPRGRGAAEGVAARDRTAAGRHIHRPRKERGRIREDLGARGPGAAGGTGGCDMRFPAPHDSAARRQPLKAVARHRHTLREGCNHHGHRGPGADRDAQWLRPWGEYGPGSAVT
ncbi:recombinase family protein [Streptomyces sp. NBC_00873]|uniref:recombinase family protein n=1 Tax=unclassified Streptomyces TaxID=2593676 RepID=UPI00386C6A2A|nr:recombinase family protein [Streptomyces sp. NBC_00873]WTA48188.1 recombinase family protein [Streptomyces sp. NBC_00842]